MKKNLTIISTLSALALLVSAFVTSYPPTQAQINDLALTANAGPNDFILSWSTDSYVPADYEGKALPTRGSKIKIVALPTKRLVQAPALLYYRWLLDDEIMGYANGQGKSVFEFTATKWAGGIHEIESQILDSQEGNIISRNFLSIKIVEPQILLRQPENDYAAKNTLSAQTGWDINLSGIPLFFHIKNLSEIDWQWTLDNQNLSSPEEKNPGLLVLKMPGGELSQIMEKSLSVNATNKGERSQQALVNLNIEIK